MFYYIYTAILLLAITLHYLIEANQDTLDKEVNNLFCQLNEFAVMRLNNGETLFPCHDESDN